MPTSTPLRAAATVPPQRLRLPHRRPADETVAAAHTRLTGAGVPIPLRLWDGTEIGPNERGYRLMLRRPWSARTALLPPTDRQLGEAYLRDDLDVEGSMVAAIADLAARRAQLERPGLRAALLAELLRLPTPPTRAEVGRPAELAGRAHSRGQVLAARGDADLPLGRAWMLPDVDAERSAASTGRHHDQPQPA